MKRIPILFLSLFFFLACNTYQGLPSIDINNDWKVKKLAASSQATTGDADMGFQYLIEGDYIGDDLSEAERAAVIEYLKTL